MSPTRRARQFCKRLDWLINRIDLAAGLVESVVIDNLGRHWAADEGRGIVRDIEARLLREGCERLPIGTVVNAAVDVLSERAKTERHLEIVDGAPAKIELLGLVVVHGPKEGGRD